MHTIGMLLFHGRSPRDEQAWRDLAEALPDAEFTEPDELGVFEIRLEAPDQDAALQRIWDAVAATGGDDHLLFLEHPSLPEHWRHVSGSPGGG
jgi:hypothetical protein